MVVATPTTWTPRASSVRTSREWSGPRSPSSSSTPSCWVPLPPWSAELSDGRGNQVSSTVPSAVRVARPTPLAPVVSAAVVTDVEATQRPDVPTWPQGPGGSRVRSLPWAGVSAPAEPAPELDLTADVLTLTRALVDAPSVSGNEGPLADAVEAALRHLGGLEVERVGDTVLARTNLDLPTRIVLAGHLDTVPIAGNLPSRIDTVDGEDRLYGCGTSDMKSGDAVMLRLAARFGVPGAQPARDLTFVFYDNEEVEAVRNGLGRVARERRGRLYGGPGLPPGAPGGGGTAGLALRRPGDPAGADGRRGRGRLPGHPPGRAHRSGEARAQRPVVAGR